MLAPPGADVRRGVRNLLKRTGADMMLVAPGSVSAGVPSMLLGPQPDVTSDLSPWGLLALVICHLRWATWSCSSRCYLGKKFVPRYRRLGDVVPGQELFLGAADKCCSRRSVENRR